MTDTQTRQSVAENGAWGYMATPGFSRSWRIVDGAYIEIRCYWGSDDG